VAVAPGPLPDAHQGAHVAVRADLPDAVVVRIRDDDVALAIHRHATRMTEVRLRPVAVAPGPLPAAREDGDLRCQHQSAKHYYNVHLRGVISKQMDSVSLQVSKHKRKNSILCE
jgi:hypothetical protein